MRVSRLMLTTLRDVPANAEIISHKLLLRGGYIRRVTSGIYAYMPLMWRVLQKITLIVQEEMNKCGSLQTLLPQLHPAKLWQSSGRWAGYTAGEGIMFHLKDRQGKEIGLAPTHEEVITNIAGEILRSYKQLPVSIYQIQTKFRDEIRPRFGLMRSREFIMKDGYSFHANEESLKDTYQQMNIAYTKIFRRCGVHAVGVEADSGAIGGAASQEFMVTADAGEDLILTSQDGKYSANQEKAVSQPCEANNLIDEPSGLINTPGLNTIEKLCLDQDFESTQVVKVILLLALLENKKQQPILVSIRGDQELNEVKLINSLHKEIKEEVLKIKPINNQDLQSQGLNKIPFGYIGPDLNDSVLSPAKSWEKSFLRLTDETAAQLKTFICGANKIDYHVKSATWKELGGISKTVDLRKAKAGDQCVHDSSQFLTEKRGIEVGHIFQLGKKYSESLNSNFTNENGIQENFWMGCYGIGVSRLAQAAVEQHHDESGICWPIAIAPFEVVVVIANIQDPIQSQLGEDLYQQLLNEGVDALIDDRNERAGVKFKDADLIGIPWRIVVGRDAARGEIELFERSSKKTQALSAENALKFLLEDIASKKS